MQSKINQNPAVSLEMHAHDSTGFDEKAKNQKTVTKRDGSIETFNADELTSHLTSMCGGLNMEYINVEVIVGKVSKGLPQGKYRALINTYRCENFPNCRPVC
jgi:hypothetical protein